MRPLFRISKLLSRRQMYSFLDGVLEQLSERGPINILNVGSGGEVGRKLSRLPEANITSVDIDPARKPDIVADVCKMELSEQYDVIFMVEVLEHVKQPSVAISNIRNHLKSNGLLILTTPFIFPLHDEPHDYYRFTRYGLEYLLAEFSSISVQERNGWLEAMHVLIGRMIFAESRRSRIIGGMIFLFSIPLAPVSLVLQYLFESRQVTSGYLVQATK